MNTQRIIEISDKVRELCSDTVSDKLIKLQEELGEASSEHLAVIGTNNKSKSAVGTKEARLEELIDVLITTVDLINNCKVDGVNTDDIIDRKLAKWAAKFDLSLI